MSCSLLAMKPLLSPRIWEIFFCLRSARKAGRFMTA